VASGSQKLRISNLFCSAASNYCDVVRSWWGGQTSAISHAPAPVRPVAHNTNEIFTKLSLLGSGLCDTMNMQASKNMPAEVFDSSEYETQQKERECQSRAGPGREQGESLTSAPWRVENLLSSNEPVLTSAISYLTCLQFVELRPRVLSDDCIIEIDLVAACA